MSFKDIIETIKVRQNAKLHSAIDSPQNASDRFSAETSSKTNPPTIIGTLSRKLYSADFVSSFPQKTSDAMVVPDLDNPGSTAKPCAKPTTNADLYEISGGEIVIDFCLNLWHKNKMIAVIKKQKP